MNARSGFRQRVRSGEPTIGTFLSLGSPIAAEACAIGGFEWLLVDLEHGAGGEDALSSQVLAGRAHDVPVLVRVETAERIRVGRALDLGADGVMLPRLDSAAEVTEAVRHLSYPPEGDRGVASYNRARRFGFPHQTLEQANDSTLGIVQIESRAAVSAVDEIAALPHVDVLFVGPGDLSSSLGVPNNFTAPAFRAALDRVVGAARTNGIAAGILAGDAEAARAYLEKGFSFIGVGSDAILLAVTSQRIVAETRATQPAGRPRQLS